MRACRSCGESIVPMEYEAEELVYQDWLQARCTGCNMMYALPNVQREANIAEIGRLGGIRPDAIADADVSATDRTVSVPRGVSAWVVAVSRRECHEKRLCISASLTPLECSAVAGSAILALRLMGIAARCVHLADLATQADDIAAVRAACREFATAPAVALVAGATEPLQAVAQTIGQAIDSLLSRSGSLLVAIPCALDSWPPRREAIERAADEVLGPVLRRTLGAYRHGVYTASRTDRVRLKS